PHQQRARVPQLLEHLLRRRADPRRRHVLRTALERLLHQRLGRQALARSDLYQRIDGWDRRRGHTRFQTTADRLPRQRAHHERQEETESHRLTARTMRIEFSRPKSSSTRRSARRSVTQRSPSTTNMYSYVPVGSTTVARHTPSWSRSSRGIEPVRQSLKEPTTCTL